MNRTLDVVDAQVHLTLELDEPALLAAMTEHGIRSVIVDEFWYITEELQSMPGVPMASGRLRAVSPYAQAAALRHPERVSYLQRVDSLDPELGAVLRLLSADPGGRALRLLLLTKAHREALGAGGYDEILELAQTHGLPVCLLGPDVATLPAVAERFPSLRLVLDHCGWARNPSHWEDILNAAAIPTLFLKWSHAHRAFGSSENPAETIQQQFERAVKVFGAERVMWASDITQEESDASWGELLAFVRDNPALSSTQKEWVLSRTARTVFGWDANPANTDDEQER